MKKVCMVLALLFVLAQAAESSRGPLLLVDDDGSDGGYVDVRAVYTDALDGAGFWGQYDVWDVPHNSDGPTGADLSPYTAVIWFTGEIYGQGNAVTLTANDEGSLAAYLDAGGKLFLCSQDYWWDRYPGYGSFSAGEFPYDYLQSRSATQDPNPAQPFTAYGDSATIGEGMTQSVTGDSPIPQYYDQFTHAATGCFNDGASCIGTQFDGGVYQVVWLSWPLENIADGTPPNTKADLIYAVLTWFGLIPPTDDVGVTSIPSPPPVIDPYQPVAPSATITNYGANPQYDFDVHCRIDSATTVIYDESIHIDSIVPAEVKQLDFPVSDTLAEGVSYILTVCHDLLDQNPSNDTLSMDLLARWGCVYDDGERDDELRTDYAGCEVAHRLTPPAYPYAVDSLAVYVYGYYSGVPFEVRLYEDGGGQPPTDPVGLIPPIPHTASGWNWWVDGIVPHNVVIGSGDFYLVVKYLSDGAGRTPSVGLDTDPPIHDRGWWANVGGPPPPYDWVLIRAMGYFANPMMRAYGHRLPGIEESTSYRLQVTGYKLEQNQPNPFTAVTSVQFSVPAGFRDQQVTLRVYDISGRLIRTLFDETLTSDRLPLTTAVLWDGRDGSDRQVASGVYFYRMKAGDFRSTKKLVVLR